jgi:hypothetical protein
VTSADGGTLSAGRRGVTLIMPVAYDFRMATASIDAVAPYVDHVIIGSDKDSITWAGNWFNDAGPSGRGSMLEWYRAIQASHSPGKVHGLRESFYDADKNPLENETAERCWLAAKAGHEAPPGDWLLSLDADETLLNPEALPDFLATADRRVQWSAATMEVVKVFEIYGKALIVDPMGINYVPILTTARSFNCARFTGQDNQPSPLRLIHQSFGRSDQDLTQKLRNWGHANETNAPALLTWWRALTPDRDTWGKVKDFRPYASSPVWPALKLIDL